MNKVLEWVGSITAISGALLLALNNEYSGYGFVMFLISNVFWVLFGFRTKMYSMLSMQTIFTIINVLGIYEWMVI